MDNFLASDIAEIADRLGPLNQELAGRTVMITGSQGFLGRYFTQFLAHLNQNVLERPCRLHLLDNLITAGEAGESIPDLPHATFFNRDVSQLDDWTEPVDFIIHAAGIASPFYYRAYPLQTLEVAVSGTRNMLAIADKNRARMVFFSSSEIYGDPEPSQVPTQESYRGNVSCRGPRACYDESKRVGETLCYIFHERFGTNVMTIRPFNVYGPGMQERDYRVLPNFASRIKAGRPLKLYGTGTQTRTFCYVTDAIVGFMQTLLRGVPGEAYNIGNPSPEVSMRDLVAAIERALGRPVEHSFTDYPDSYPADEPMRRCPDIRKAELQLGYAPRVTLEDGLKRFLGWTERAFTGLVA
jgi:UDP-glucuronate decarboxylase